MISWEQGLGMLRNWQTQNTPLWLLSLLTADFAERSDVTVKVASMEPEGVVLAVEGSDDLLPFDLAGAVFDELNPDFSPFPDIPAERFVRLLRILLPDETELVLAEVSERLSSTHI